MRQMYSCPICRAPIAYDARFCGSCASPITPEYSAEAPPAPPPTQPEQQAYYEKPPEPSGGASNRALISLVLGILGLVLCGPFTGVPGIILGKMELDAIRRGTSAPSNEGLARAGFYVSIAATVLSVLLCMLFGMLGMFGALFG